MVGKLRAEGFDGRIALYCEEPVPPYQRPPLSKGYLLGEMERERLFLRPAAHYTDIGIDLHLGAKVSEIDPVGKSVTASGVSVTYDALALTTGSIPRRLPDAIGGDLTGVNVVRTLADVDSMAPEFAPGRSALIVGGGYIGLEAAAVAARKGLSVTLIELAPRILQRVASPETSDFVREIHKAHGVDIREGIGLDRLLGDNRVTGARLSDGEELSVDVVVAGVGIEPNTGLAEAAGLKIENGIAVDAFGQTSDPFIWSAGDCASFPWRNGRVRLECVQNAIDQAECIAGNMLGGEAPYEPVPWFWSDQYDLKLQIAGLNTGYDTVVVRQGERAGTQSHWYYAGDRLLAVDAMSDPRAYMVGKRLLEMGRSPPASVISDSTTELKPLLKA